MTALCAARSSDTSPPAGVYFTALSSKFKIILCSSSSSPISDSGLFVCTVSFNSLRAASTCAARAHSVTTSFRLTGSLIIAGASNGCRARIKRSSTMRESRSASSLIKFSDALYSSMLRGWASATSVSPRSTASGVRNSCDASATNRCCCLKEFSRRASKSLIVVARPPSSSRLFVTSSRAERLSAVMRRVCWSIKLIGDRLLRART